MVKSFLRSIQNQKFTIAKEIVLRVKNTGNKLFGQTGLQFEPQEELQTIGFDSKLKTALEYDPKGKGV
jgi:hypothetical protein